MRELSLEEAAVALGGGEAVVFPTDTVFGLGVSVDACQGPETLYELKHRDAGKPVAWLVEGPEALDAYGEGVPAYAHRLARAFWPGGLTLVVRASWAVPAAFQSAAGTIGLRMPASEAALDLLGAVGCPLAVTSANRSGDADVARPEDLDARLVADTAGIFLPDSFPTGVAQAAGVASTVLDCTADAPRVLRAGALTLDDMKGCLP